MHIQLDTSSLSEAVKDEALLGTLIEAAKRHRWVLSISRFAFDEFMAAGQRERLVAKCAALVRLQRGLQGRLIYSASARKLFASDLDGRLRGIVPSDDHETITRITRYVGATGRVEDTTLRLLGPYITAWKESNEADSRIRRSDGYELFRNEGFTAKSIGETLSHFIPSDVPSFIYESLVSDLAGRPRFPLWRIHGNPRRYRIVRAWASLAYLVMFSDAVPPAQRNQHEITKWMKPDRNNWFDAGVAASAAYAAVFVTDDRNLATRCKWLRERRCISFETKTLAELLAAA